MSETALVTVEIERKFLVASDAWKADVRSTHRLLQFYLSRGGRASVRVRIEDDAKAWLTIKSASAGMVRSELEYAIPIAHAHEMRALAEGGVIEKVRHEVGHAGHLWEIDVFAGENAGLVVAEVELEAPEARVDLPAWIGREVTDDPHYYNASLAVRPYLRW